MKQNLMNNIQIITNLATAGAFLITVYQFCQYRSDLRIQRAMELNYKFIEDPVRSIWKNIDLQNSEFAEIKNLKTPNQVNNYLNNRIENNDWFTLYGFFSRIYTCSTRLICDKNTIDPLILESGKKFFNNYNSFFCEYISRKKDKNDLSLLKKTIDFYLPKRRYCRQ